MHDAQDERRRPWNPIRPRDAAYEQQQIYEREDPRQLIQAKTPMDLMIEENNWKTDKNKEYDEHAHIVYFHPSFDR